ncbi:MAG: hypothetical protein ACRC68_04345 [Clostridium sp.]
MKYEEIYSKEVKMFNDIVSRYEAIQENDIYGAYKLMKESLQSYNRWSKIKCDIRKDLGRGEGTAIKNRLEEMCKYLKEVHTTARMIWSRAKDEYKHNEDE